MTRDTASCGPKRPSCHRIGAASHVLWASRPGAPRVTLSPRRCRPWPLCMPRSDLLSVCLPLQWDLVCGNAWKVHIAKFSLLVGLIFGYLITGCIADW